MYRSVLCRTPGGEKQKKIELLILNLNEEEINWDTLPDSSRRRRIEGNFQWMKVSPKCEFLKCKLRLENMHEVICKIWEMCVNNGIFRLPGDWVAKIREM